MEEKSKAPGAALAPAALGNQARDIHCVGSALVKADYDRLAEDEKVWMTHGIYTKFLGDGVCFQHGQNEY